MAQLSELFSANEPSYWHPAHFDQPENQLPRYVPTEPDRVLFDLLNRYMCEEPTAAIDLGQIENCFRRSSLPQHFNRLFFVIYAPGRKRFVLSRSYAGGEGNFSALFGRMLDRLKQDYSAAEKFSLQIDFVEVPPAAVDLANVGMTVFGERHFEIGLDGLIIQGDEGSTRYFLPGDAYVRSIMSMKQLREYLDRAYGSEYLAEATFRRFRTKSYLMHADSVYSLYRGLPVQGGISKGRLEFVVEQSIKHIKKTQEGNGKFLYYYDSMQDTKRDFQHWNRHPEKNPYYNILRHSGGALTCVYHEIYSNKADTLENIQKAIEYLLATAVFYELEGRQAAYIYSEKKSKLGGAGIGLYLLCLYELTTADDSYRYFADALAWHTVKQVTESGEFIYYNIYLDKKVSVDDNRNYFSFYYPGEAVCGLAKYLHLIAPGEREYYFERLEKALDYLLTIRPAERAEEYTEVPSDSWLMMGISELWDFDRMQNPAYAEFVFADAKKMIDQMYKVSDAPYPDYAGSFYYEYGDYPYSDGARLEGLMGAYELAHKLGNQEVKRKLWPALLLGAWSVMHLVNFDETLYCARRPEMGLGGIRFKFTRQWFRIDTIQHVASFYAKLLPYWDEAMQGFESVKR